MDNEQMNIPAVPETNDKYELLDYFTKQQEGRRCAAPVLGGSHPHHEERTQEKPCRKMFSWREVLAESTLTDWLLALIAFLLILQLVTRK